MWRRRWPDNSAERLGPERLVTCTAEAMYRREGGGIQLPRRLPVRARLIGEALADWCVQRYPVRRHAGAVMGATHGSAAHLAALLHVPWLPLPVVDRAHMVLPRAYRELIDDGLRTAAPIVVATTATAPTDPVQQAVAALAEYAVHAGHRPTVVRAPSETLSATVAELYRAWLRKAGKIGNRLIVESGPLLDPWHVLRAGLVPYWCPDAGLRHADALTWWLAGEDRFSGIEILLQPPGLSAAAPDLDGWHAATRFASRRGVVESRCRRAFPDRPLPGRHATRVLRHHPCDLPLPPPLPVADALAAMTQASAV